MKQTLFFALVFASQFLNSQTIKYSFGQEFETVKKHADFGFYKLDENKYAEAYYRKGEDMIFQVYDGRFNSIKQEVVVDLPVESEDYTHERFSSVKNDYFWFYSTWERKTQTERLFARSFDKNAMKFKSGEIKLIETDKLASFYGQGKYTFNYSTDSTKMLVTYRTKPREKRDKLNKDIIGFNLFDHQMKKIYGAEIEMPYSEADMDNLDYEIDSRGNVYMLTRVKLNNSIDGEKSKEDKRAYRYELIRVNQQNNTLQSVKIGLDGKYTSSVVLSEDLNNNIVITGYYSNDKNVSSVNGAYIIKLELDDKNSIKKLNTTYCEFPADVLKAYESERVKRKMDKKEKNDALEASNLSFDRIIFNKDGSMLIIGEEYYVVTNTYYNGKTTTTTYTYHYNDILVLKADKDGKTQWARKIPKSQSGSSTGDLSYHFHQYKNNYYFFYLDNVKNIDLTLDETPAPHSSGRGGYLTGVLIDETGKMKKQSIFNIKDEEVRIYPRYFESINENLIVDRIKEDRKNSKVFKLDIK